MSSEEFAASGIKMVSGEEFIGQIYMTDRDDIIIVKNAKTPMRDSSGKLIFVDFPLTSAGNELVIRKDSVIFIYNINDEIFNAYRTALSGIITPASNKIIM